LGEKETGESDGEERRRLESSERERVTVRAEERQRECETE